MSQATDTGFIRRIYLDAPILFFRLAKKPYWSTDAFGMFTSSVEPPGFQIPRCGVKSCSAMSSATKRFGQHYEA